MRKIKIYTMQKNESDILEEWILYHSKITDIKNIYVIDNYSTDKSIDILKKYNLLGLNIFVEGYKDYKKKGVYIYDLIKNTSCGDDIVIPLDIDEFIGIINPNDKDKELIHRCVSLNENYYKKIYFKEFKLRSEYIHHYITEIYKTPKDNNTHPSNILNRRDITDEYYYIYGYIDPDNCLSMDVDNIKNYLQNLKIHNKYSFSYYFTSINTKPYYANPVKDINLFQLDNIHGHNKKFFTSDKLLHLDHGNHTGKTIIDGDIKYTSLFLFHYHFRGYIKLIDKCYNDIKGLNIVKDINNKKLLQNACNNNVMGSHNISEYIKFMDDGIYQFGLRSNGKIIYKKNNEL